MLCIRLVSMCVLIPVIVFILFLSSKIHFLLFLCIICLISSWEWGRLMHFSFKIHYLWICLMSILLFNTVILIDQSQVFNNIYRFILLGIFGLVSIWWVLMFVTVLFYPYSANFWSKSVILRYVFGIFIILPFFLGMLILYKLPDLINDFNGKWFALCILLLVWLNDSSAYVVGKSVGKSKLLYRVSPKKTWEGCIAGILLSTGMAWLLSKCFIQDIGINFYVIFICFIGVILFSVIGDLTESMFKRESRIKDTGNLIPGHGGMLDRMDSLFAAVPVFVFLLLLFFPVNIIEM